MACCRSRPYAVSSFLPSDGTVEAWGVAATNTTAAEERFQTKNTRAAGGSDDGGSEGDDADEQPLLKRQRVCSSVASSSLNKPKPERCRRRHIEAETNDCTILTNASNIKDAWEELARFRVCMKAIYRVSPGIPGARMIELGGDECARAGHWNLIVGDYIRDKTTFTAFAVETACRAGRNDAVKYLLKTCGGLSSLSMYQSTTVNPNQWTLLHVAAACGHEHVMFTLVQFGALDSPDIAGVRASHLRPFVWETIQSLQGQETWGEEELTAIVQQRKQEQSVFNMRAPIIMDVEMIVHTLTGPRQEPLNLRTTGALICACVDTWGPSVLERETTESEDIEVTILDATVLANSPSLCQLCLELLDLQLFPSRKHILRNAIQFACHENRAECLRILLLYVGQFSLAQGEEDETEAAGTGCINVSSLLVDICFHGSVDCLDVMLEFDGIASQLDHTNKENLTPLMECSFFESPASPEDKYQCAKRLLQKGANSNFVSLVSSNTALHFACQDQSFARVVHLLLEYGADATAINANGRTPLMVACFAYNAHAIRALKPKLSEDDIDDAIVHAGTPLWDDAGYAQLYSVCIALFCRDGKYYDDELSPQFVTVDSDRWSPLHLASFWGRLKCIVRLLELGADVDARDFNDRTPGDVARTSAVGNVLREIWADETFRPEGIAELRELARSSEMRRHRNEYTEVNFSE